MTITAKTTKAEIRDYIEASSKKKAVKANKKLAEVIKKALNIDIKKVKREDLVKVANAITKVLSTPATAETVQAENSTKKISKKAKKEEPKTEEKETSKKSKKSNKKAEELKDSRSLLATKENFPEELEVGETKLKKADDLKTMEDILNAFEDETLMFAFYFPKRRLKQELYFGGILGQPKSFDNDLDLTSLVYVSDDKKVAYTVSNYTEAVFIILEEDLEKIDGIRIAGDTEFEIYRVVD